MPADDVGDDDEPGLPPHPFDRVWFHPSELGSPAPPAPAPPTSRSGGPLAAAALLGALAIVVILGAAGALDGGSPVVTPGGVATAASAFGSDPVAVVAASSSPSVVAVRAAAADPATAPTVASGVALGRHEVLTGAGVVAGATTVTVATDGRVLDATVVGVDPHTDLALLRVPDGELVPARLGEAAELTVGQGVIGLGIAGGDHRWVGHGVVSSLDRLATTPSGILLAGLVETDLRPGAASSGGALLDLEGRVVGVLVGAAPGRALPIEWARDVADQLATSGQARHGWMGTDAQDAADRPGGGARLTLVAGGTPAEAAGLQPGDVVSAAGPERVTDVADLVAAVSRLRPGDSLALVLWRGEERMRVEVTLGDRSAPGPAGGV